MKRLLSGLLNVIGVAYWAVGIVVGFIAVFILLMIMGFGPFGLPVWLASFLGATALSTLSVVMLVKNVGDHDSLAEDILGQRSDGSGSIFFDD